MADDGFVLNIVSSSGGAPKKRPHQEQKLQRRIQSKFEARKAGPQSQSHKGSSNGAPSPKSHSAAAVAAVVATVTAAGEGVTQMAPNATLKTPGIGSNQLGKKDSKQSGDKKVRQIDPNDVSKAVMESYMREHYPEERKRKTEVRNVALFSIGRRRKSADIISFFPLLLLLLSLLVSRFLG